MALSETAIRRAKPGEGKKVVTLSGGDGLILVVKDTGAKRWVPRFWHDGKEKRAGLGKYPIVSLADAREMKTSS